MGDKAGAAPSKDAAVCLGPREKDRAMATVAFDTHWHTGQRRFSFRQQESLVPQQLKIHACECVHVHVCTYNICMCVYTLLKTVNPFAERQ